MKTELLMSITVREFESLVQERDELKGEIALWTNPARSVIHEMNSLVQERDALRNALKNLLDDTQHAEHEDCEDGPCPVREARAALGAAK